MKKPPLNRTKNLSRFLSDVYKTDVDLYFYLRQLGFSEVQTRHLICNCIDELANATRESTQTIFVMKHDGERLSDLTARRYGIEKTTRNDLRSLGVEFGISGERVRQLIKKAIRMLGNPKARTFFENDLRNQLGIVIQQNPVSLVVNDEVIPEEMTVIEIADTVKKKSYTFEEIRQKYPRAYMVWTEEEENQLMDLIDQGMTTGEIAVQLQRKIGAIRSRIKKMELRNI